jgi:hypothetical protein
LIIFMLFSGLLANVDSIWVGIRWIQWIDVIAYTYKALGQNEFDSSLTFDCPPGSRCFVDGAEVTSAYALNAPSLWLCIFINLGSICYNNSIYWILCDAWNCNFQQNISTSPKTEIRLI